MLKVSIKAIFLVLPALIFLSACGGGGGGNGDNLLPGRGETREVTVSPDSAISIDLASGNKLTFPAGSFTQSTIIVFSDNIVGIERDTNTYPEGTQSFEGYCTINNPASEANAFQKDVTLTLALRTAVTPGTKYILYRFNADNVKWEPFGSALAEVDSSGIRATAILPTTGIFYTIGPVGVFTGKTVGDGGPELPGGAFAVLTGTVRIGSSSGDPAQEIDLLLFIVDGGNLVPYDFLNGEADPQNPNNHNYIETDVNGRYEMRFAEGDVGAGKLFKIIIARYDNRYNEAESAVFSISEGANPDKDFVVTPVS